MPLSRVGAVGRVANVSRGRAANPGPGRPGPGAGARGLAPPAAPEAPGLLGVVAARAPARARVSLRDRGALSPGNGERLARRGAHRPAVPASRQCRTPVALGFADPGPRP